MLVSRTLGRKRPGISIEKLRIYTPFFEGEPREEMTKLWMWIFLPKSGQAKMPKAWFLPRPFRLARPKVGETCGLRTVPRLRHWIQTASCLGLFTCTKWIARMATSSQILYPVTAASANFWSEPVCVAFTLSMSMYIKLIHVNLPRARLDTCVRAWHGMISNLLHATVDKPQNDLHPRV